MSLSPQSGEIAFRAQGSLRLHSWTEKAYREGSDADLYSLVMRQGAALEFADFRGAQSPCAQWNLAEAGDCWVGGAAAPELFWIRIPVKQSRQALPLQSAGLVLQRAVQKVGVASIDLLEVLVPLEFSRQDPMPLAYGRDWFEFSDPAGRRPATIELITAERSWDAAEIVAKVAPWLGDCVSFGPPASQFNVVLGSDTLDFLAWVAEVFSWAVADGSSESHLQLRFTFLAEDRA